MCVAGLVPGDVHWWVKVLVRLIPALSNLEATLKWVKIDSSDCLSSRLSKIGLWSGRVCRKPPETGLVLGKLYYTRDGERNSGAPVSNGCEQVTLLVPVLYNQVKLPHL